MQVEILSLCVAARPGINMEINVLGITDTLGVLALPAVIPNITIIARQRFDKMEEGIKEIKFSFVDPDGNAVAKPPLPQKVTIRIADKSSSASTVMVVGMQNVHLKEAGDYEIGLVVNERREMSVPVNVRLSGLTLSPPPKSP